MTDQDPYSQNQDHYSSQSFGDGQQVSIDQRQLIKFIAVEAAKAAEEKLQAQQTRRWQLLFTLLTLAAAGFGTLAVVGIDGYVAGKVEQHATSVESKERATKSTEQIVEAQLEKSFGEINEKFEAFTLYPELKSIATILDQKDAFSPEERDKALEMLRRAKEIGIEERFPTFSTHVLAKVVDAFFQAGQGAAIYSLDEIYHNEMAKSDDIIAVMLQHIGRDVMLDPEVPLNGLDSKTAKQLKAYTAATLDLTDKKLHGVAYFNMALLNFRINNENRNPKSDSYVSRATNMPEIASLFFIYTAHKQSAVERFQREPTPEGQEIARIVSKFSDAYKTEIGKIRTRMEGSQDIQIRQMYESELVDTSTGASSGGGDEESKLLEALRKAAESAGAQ